MAEQKTPWKKNLDRRYISGEDLKDGTALNKGLRSEMVVTFERFNDAPAFDQKLNRDETKTAVWLKEFPNGKILYKPCLLNNKRGKFLEAEIGSGSMFMEDFDKNRPFIIYAEPSSRFGHVVGFRKYSPPDLVLDSDNYKACLAALKNGTATIEKIEAKYNVTAGVREALLK